MRVQLAQQAQEILRQSDLLVITERADDVALLIGQTAAAMDVWITAGVTQGEAGALARIWRTNDQGHEGLAAEGYEFERTCCAPDGAGQWSERVMVVRAPIHADHQAAG